MKPIKLSKQQKKDILKIAERIIERKQGKKVTLKEKEDKPT